MENGEPECATEGVRQYSNSSYMADRGVRTDMRVPLSRILENERKKPKTETTAKRQFNVALCDWMNSDIRITSE